MNELMQDRAGKVRHIASRQRIVRVVGWALSLSQVIRRLERKAHSAHSATSRWR